MLEEKKIVVGRSYRLSELPAGIIFQWGNQLFKTILYPDFNLPENNIMAETFAIAERRNKFFPSHVQVIVRKIL